MLQPKTPKQKKNIKDATQMKNMRPTGPTTGRVKPKMGTAKNGKSFPDLNKDGKITKADILKGRGVIAKKGATMKKAQSGVTTDSNTTIEKAKLDRKYNTTYRTMKRDSIKESNEKVLPKVYNQMRKETGKSPSSEDLRKRVDKKNKEFIFHLKIIIHK